MARVCEKTFQAMEQGVGSWFGKMEFSLFCSTRQKCP